jgi:hypothetical protein
VVLAVALLGSADAANAHPGHPVKSLHIDKWYQRYEDTYNYVEWMTLRGSAIYLSNFATNWQTPVNNARASYNSSGNAGGQHTVYIANYAPSELDDVRVTVTNSSWCFPEFFICVHTLGNLGLTWLYDEALHECVGNGDCDAQHSRPNTWWYAFPTLDNDAHEVAPYNTSFQRQATAAHEYGHAIGIAHDGLGDGSCINTPLVRQSVMDFDCLNLNILNGPQAWDSCGINHKYYDPNWGYAGC